MDHTLASILGKAGPIALSVRRVSIINTHISNIRLSYKALQKNSRNVKSAHGDDVATLKIVYKAE